MRINSPLSFNLFHSLILATLKRKHLLASLQNFSKNNVNQLVQISARINEEQSVLMQKYLQEVNCIGNNCRRLVNKVYHLIIKWVSQFIDIQVQKQLTCQLNNIIYFQECKLTVALRKIFTVLDGITQRRIIDLQLFHQKYRFKFSQRNCKQQTLDISLQSRKLFSIGEFNMLKKNSQNLKPKVLIKEISLPLIKPCQIQTTSNRKEIVKSPVKKKITSQQKIVQVSYKVDKNDIFKEMQQSLIQRNRRADKLINNFRKNISKFQEKSKQKL